MAEICETFCRVGNRGVICICVGENGYFEVKGSVTGRAARKFPWFPYVHHLLSQSPIEFYMSKIAFSERASRLFIAKYRQFSERLVNASKKT